MNHESPTPMRMDDALMTRMRRLRGGDRSRAVDVELAIDRAFAQEPRVQRVFRRRSAGALVAADATRLSELFAAIVSEVASAPMLGSCQRTIMAHAEVDARRAVVVVEVADLRRVWCETADETESHSIAEADTCTGLAVSLSTHRSLGSVVRVELPISNLGRAE